MTAGSYPDDGLGEVFLKMGKQGSTLAGVMDAFSIAISIALQHGVPLETYVQKFTNLKFEPAGLTDDPDVRMAQSIMDYIFRRLALDYLPFDERAALGIYTADERSRQLDTGSYEPAPVEVSEAESLKAVEPVAEKAEPTPRSTPPRPSRSTGRGPHHRRDVRTHHRHLGRRTALLHLRHQDAPQRFLLRLRRLRQHLRLQLTPAESATAPGNFPLSPGAAARHLPPYRRAPRGRHPVQARRTEPHRGRRLPRPTGRIGEFTDSPRDLPVRCCRRARRRSP